MTDAANILFLGDGLLGSQLSQRLSRNQTLLPCADPYDALLEMGRRRWPVVLMTAPRGDFAGLCRAARRLQAAARIMALCPPAAEPDVRQLLGKTLDDYFISPPTRQEVDEIAALAACEPPATGPGDQLGLTARQFAQLAECSRDVEALENSVAEMVSKRLGLTVAWKDVQDVPVPQQPLLFAAGDRPRVLVTEGRVEQLDDRTEAFISAVQQCMPALLATARRTQSLHRLAITDNLTGTYNRRYFYHLTDRILTRAGDEQFGATLLLYDIDDFKHYNDTYGYAAGDEILRETAALMKQMTRSQDVVARIGGDEFAVLFWEPGEPRRTGSRPPATAYALADRFRKTVSTHTFPSLGPEATGALTISGGLAGFPDHGRTCRELLSHADRAIKAAKRSGKNAIQLIG